MSMFEVVCKSHVFSRKTIENVSLTCLVLRVEPIGTLNRNLKPAPNSFRCHEFNFSLRILKRASVINHIFRGKFFLLDLRKTLITWYPGLYFANKAYPWTRVDE